MPPELTTAQVDALLGARRAIREAEELVRRRRVEWAQTARRLRDDEGVSMYAIAKAVGLAQSRVQRDIHALDDVV